MRIFYACIGVSEVIFYAFEDMLIQNQFHSVYNLITVAEWYI